MQLEEEYLGELAMLVDMIRHEKWGDADEICRKISEINIFGHLAGDALGYSAPIEAWQEMIKARNQKLDLCFNKLGDRIIEPYKASTYAYDWLAIESAILYTDNYKRAQNILDFLKRTNGGSYLYEVIIRGIEKVIEFRKKNGPNVVLPFYWIYMDSDEEHIYSKEECKCIAEQLINIVSTESLLSDAERLLKSLNSIEDSFEDSFCIFSIATCEIRHALERMQQGDFTDISEITGMLVNSLLKLPYDQQVN